MARSLLIGLGEIGLGLLLIGPTDEIATTILSGGTGLAAVPIQAPASAAVGALLCLDGIKKLG